MEMLIFRNLPDFGPMKSYVSCCGGEIRLGYWEIGVGDLASVTRKQLAKH